MSNLSDGEMRAHGFVAVEWPLNEGRVREIVREELAAWVCSECGEAGRHRGTCSRSVMRGGGALGYDEAYARYRKQRDG